MEAKVIGQKKDDTELWSDYLHSTDPISVCRKRLVLTTDGMKTRKHCTQKKLKLGSAVGLLWLLAFPRDIAARIPRTLHWDKNVMESNL